MYSKRDEGIVAGRVCSCKTPGGSAKREAPIKSLIDKYQRWARAEEVIRLRVETAQHGGTESIVVL